MGNSENKSSSGTESITKYF